MKKLVFLSMLSGLTCFSQSLETEISVASENRDTLWLIDDDLGKLIAQSWEIETGQVQSKPVIILVDKLPYRRRKRDR